MINLLQETLGVLKENGKTKNDIVWVGCSDFQIPWDAFAEMSNTEYDNGCGMDEVNGNLLIVGTNFWLERHEHDGSEWWEFKTLPTIPVKIETSKILQKQTIWG